MRTWAYERKFVMPVRPLPSNPNLDHLKYQAKDLLKGMPPATSRRSPADQGISSAFQSGHGRRNLRRQLQPQRRATRHRSRVWISELGEIESAYRKANPRRSTEFAAPRAHRRRNVFRRAVELLDAGDVAGLRAHLINIRIWCISTWFSKAETTFAIPRCWNSSQRIRLAMALCRRTLFR
jgi:hypothetical protein